MGRTGPRGVQGGGAAGGVCTPRAGGPPPPTLLLSVTAFPSLLAGFGAGLGLVLSSQHLPLGHPQCPPPHPCHQPHRWGVMASHHRRAKLAKPLTPGKGGQEGSPSGPHAIRLVPAKPAPPWPGSCLHPCAAAAFPPQAVQWKKKTAKSSQPLQRVPSPPAEAGWRSQRRVLSEDGGAHVPVRRHTYRHTCARRAPSSCINPPSPRSSSGRFGEQRERRSLPSDSNRNAVSSWT